MGKQPNLVGVWTLKYNGDGRYWFSQIAFTEDSKKCVLSYQFDGSGNVSISYYINKYKIVDGVLTQKSVLVLACSCLEAIL